MKINNLSIGVSALAMALSLIVTGVVISQIGESADAEKLLALESKLEIIEDQKSFYVNEKVNKDVIQAVFLTNDDVYFGKLSDGEPGQVELTDIYYLQVQSGEASNPQSVAELEGNPSISLAKLGDELHAPEDVMYISRDQMLFWENLRSDGQVTQAIQDFQSSNQQ